uniref:Glyco_hydro_18 domain-containing protein n=1 Tax=Ascaris lumbricoides TaxID=6252 RepID=A0A0M3IEB5_ASCLU
MMPKMPVVRRLVERFSSLARLQIVAHKTLPQIVEHIFRRYGPRSPHKFGSERIIFQSRQHFWIRFPFFLEHHDENGWHGKNDRYVEGGTITTEGKAAAVSTETKKAAVQDWVRNTLQKGVDGIIAEYDHVDKLPNNASLYGDRDNVKNRYRVSAYF